MKKLTARQSILFESRIYAPGEILPTKNAGMVEAWLAAGTAVWLDKDRKPSAKVYPCTAEPGLPGEAVASEGSDVLVGKVPRTAGRKRK